MEDEPDSRFRRAFWRAFLEADTIRLRQWERSHVTLPQLRVLYQLRRHSGATTGELARRLGITVSTTSGLVIKLVDRELVTRGSLADDRRQAPLSLTEAGTALLGDLSGEMRAYMGDVAARLGDDLEGVTRALEILTEAASSEREGEAARAGEDTRAGKAKQAGEAKRPGDAPRECEEHREAMRVS
jgi:DNA-binding MarR family transcriptional regulator